MAEPLWFWVLGWFLSILTMTGNGYIVLLVSSKRQLRTKTNAFILSLAVADFCVGLSVIPSLFFCEVTRTCKMLQTSCFTWARILRWIFSDVSITNLCSLVVDRYIAIVRPLKYVTFMTRRRVTEMILFSWMFAIIFVLFESSLLLSFETPLVSKLFTCLVTIFFHLLPCLMQIFCFASMVRILHKHKRASRSLARQLGFNHRVLFKPHEKSAVVMMTIVVGLFIVCYVMYMRCGFAIIFHDRASCNDSTYKIPVLVLNSAVNPLAYAFFKRDIKRELIKKLTCRWTFLKSHKVNSIQQRG